MMLRRESTCLFPQMGSCKSYYFFRGRTVRTGERVSKMEGVLLLEGEDSESLSRFRLRLMTRSLFSTGWAKPRDARALGVLEWRSFTHILSGWRDLWLHHDGSSPRAHCSYSHILSPSLAFPLAHPSNAGISLGFVQAHFASRCTHAPVRSHLFPWFWFIYRQMVPTLMGPQSERPD